MFFEGIDLRSPARIMSKLEEKNGAQAAFSYIYCLYIPVTVYYIPQNKTV